MHSVMLSKLLGGAYGKEGSALLLCRLYLRYSFFHFLLWQMSVLSNYLGLLKYFLLAYSRVPGNLQLWCVAFIISGTRARISPWVFSGIGLSVGVVLDQTPKQKGVIILLAKEWGFQGIGRAVLLIACRLIRVFWTALCPFLFLQAIWSHLSKKINLLLKIPILPPP